MTEPNYRRRVMDFTPEQLDAVEAAFEKVAKGEYFMEDHAGITSTFCKKILAELAPKPQFVEGQVLCFVAKDGDYDFLQYHKETNMSWAGWEPLNQTEVGPDWVPLSDVLPLVKEAEYICKLPESYPIKAIQSRVKAALDALPPTIRKAAEES